MGTEELVQLDAEQGATGSRRVQPAGEARWLKSRAFHETLHSHFQQRNATLDRARERISWLRLVAFVVASVGLVIWVTDRERAALWAGGLGVAVFIVGVIVHRRILARMSEAKVRRDIHERHVSRTTRGWLQLPSPSGIVAEDHAYALDIDLVGPGSLLQRIDTTHTVWGERALVAWLTSPASVETILSRQQAVEELGAQIEFRQELEAASLDHGPAGKLSGEKFLEFVRQPALILGWRQAAAVVLPIITILILVGLWSGVAQGTAWGLLLMPQVVLVASCWKGVSARFKFLDARRPQLEALGKMLSLLEHASFETPLLRELRARLTFTAARHRIT